MNRSRETSRRTLLVGGLLAIVLGIGAWAAAPAPAAAQFPFFGWGYPRYYAPYPYYPPPAYYPYYPPQAYYPPAPDAAAYPAPASGAAPVAGAAPALSAAPTGGAQITYTNRPAFNNAAGETCREFAAAQGADAGSAPIHGTACRDAGGQWRVAK